MKFKDLPTDIKKHVIIRVVLKLIILSVILGLIGYLYYCSLVRYTEVLGVFNITLFHLFLVAIAFHNVGVVKMLSDRSWCGKVLDVQIDYVMGNSFKGLRLNVHFQSDVILKIKTDAGKIIKKRVRSYRIKLVKGVDYYPTEKVEHHLDDYRKNDMVYHFYGLRYCLVTHEKNNETCNCVVCGLRNPLNEEFCAECGHTLLQDFFTKE